MSEYKLVYPHKKRPEKNVEFICGERLEDIVGDYESTGIDGSQIPKLINQDTLESIWAKVIISPNKEDVNSEDIVWLQDEKAYSVEEPHWYIKVLEEFEEEEVEVKVLPQMRIALGKRKGGMLSAMLKGEHRKDQKK
jgi:autonomous glycyl radical cofactor GrcA